MGKFTQIIIHRCKGEDIVTMFDYTLKELEMVGINPQYKNHRGSRIRIDNLLIDFYCGDIFKMGGVRPNYFNTDSQKASEYLHGTEIGDISKLIKFIIDNTDKMGK